ncbi:MAG: peptidylprolyl isomerase [Verrucomicrobiota bacterium]
MLENLRKYRGLLVTFVIVAGLALVIGIKDDVFRSGGGGSLFRISGRTYGAQDYQRLGASSLELASILRQSGEMDIFLFSIVMTRDAEQREEEMAKQFFINRMVLREGMEKFGVRPGEEEVTQRIRTMQAFSTDGKFNEANFQRFVTRGIGRMGLTEADLRSLIADVIGFTKLSDIIGSGLHANRAAVARLSALRTERVSGHIARLDQAGFEAAIKPTDEELHAWWDNMRDAFRTDPKRKFTYVLVTPDLPKEEAAPEAPANPNATEEEKKKAAAEKAAKNAGIAEARRAKQLETDDAVDKFVYELEQGKTAEFEALAKENGWEVKTTGLFAENAAPPDLALPLRDSPQKSSAANQLFQMQPGSDPLSKISQPLAVGENQWLVARFEEEEKPRTETFEEAKVEARARYVDEKAAEALKKAAADALAKIKELTAADKSFADAAKEAGATDTREFKDVSGATQGDPNYPGNLLATTRFLDPGAFAEPLIENKRAYIIQVTKREVVKPASAEEQLTAALKEAEQNNKMAAMMSWLASRVVAANVEELFKQ